MIKLYSTDCPRCTVLLKKLKNKGIVPEVISDTSIMIKKNIVYLPMLELEDETLLDFKAAVEWINGRE